MSLLHELKDKVFNLNIQIEIIGRENINLKHDKIFLTKKIKMYSSYLIFLVTIISFYYLFYTNNNVRTYICIYDKICIWRYLSLYEFVCEYSIIHVSLAFCIIIYIAERTHRLYNFENTAKNLAVKKLQKQVLDIEKFVETNFTIVPSDEI